MPADDIVENWEAGLEEFEIADEFRMPVAEVREILQYAASHEGVAVADSLR
jgi:uncharacterized protein (DUF433 family)